MKRGLFLGWWLVAVGVAWGQPPTRVEAVASPPPKVVLHTGDLIFQISRSPQSRAIQAATGARWSHVGLLFQVDQRWQVLEAVQPVRYTPLEAWVARGDGRRAVVKRLRNRTLTQEEQASLRRVGEGYLGRPYDLAFGWSDTHIYCSELVYKVYQRALGVPIGQLVALRTFDLEHPEVKPLLRRRYGTKVPLDELVVSPAAQFDDPDLVEVGEVKHPSERSTPRIQNPFRQRKHAP